MECKDRKGMPVPSDAQQDAILRKLYGTAGGRMVLKVLVRPWVSRSEERSCPRAYQNLPFRDS